MTLHRIPGATARRHRPTAPAMRALLRGLALLVPLFAALAAPLPRAAAGGLAEALEAGPLRYYGVGWQNDGQHWSIELLLTPGGAQVAYPSAQCAGEWKRLRNLTDRVDYAERILDGTENCIALGRVSLEPLDEGRLLYTFSEEPGTVTARAVLLPVGDGKRLDYIDRLLLTLKTVRLDYLLPDHFQ